jgi:hypothetical protein
MTTPFATLVIPDRAAERAALRYVAELLVPRLGPCYLSTYAPGSHGYAQIGWTSDYVTQSTTAHRAAWQFWNGPIPAGMTVDHRCYVRRCVRVAHLRLLTNPQNASDNRQVQVNQPAGGLCRRCGDQRVAAPAGKPYCRTCKNRCRRERRHNGKRN